MMTADQIRSAFLDYFEQRGHRLVRSSSLVPESDPTLLFANAGMNQFKDVFLGQQRRDYTRAASSQKCVRAGGKHNDLENVGQTARHHTFFEMLGNFSFGDYFKREAIAYAWEFLTRDLGLAAERLKVTIFKGENGVPRDSQAHGFWLEHVAAERILELSAKDNFWAMGETGPCGPCSEIHYFQGDTLPCPEAAAGRECPGVCCECDRWLEVWNLVFMQFDRDAQGALAPLPAPCVDTGMGLERVTSVVQGKLSNYDTDLFAPLIEAVARRAGKRYGDDPGQDMSLRVLADHLRATTFLVSDGVLPGNEGRAYVLRKIMRRALRHGKKLGLEGAFLHELLAVVVERMAGAYPELIPHARGVAKVVRAEEERFSSTLRQAFAMFEQVAQKLKPGEVLPGADAFRLYDTYGLPLDFVDELAADRGLSVDHAGFERELGAQRERARHSSKLGAVTGDPVWLELLQTQGATIFTGYGALLLDDTRVLAVLEDGRLTQRLEAGDKGQIVLERTPFYARSGGQIGDRGVLEAKGAAAEVGDCHMPVPGLYVHDVSVTTGTFEPGLLVRALVDEERRLGAMRNHTGTHLLHAALRETLGTHVKQAGSLVEPERLRFDFSHYQGVESAERVHIQNLVNDQVLRNAPVGQLEMGREQALSYGALAFFGDKYGERVRVVEIPGFSKEFCGGTHVERTGDVGLFLLTHEQGIAGNTRRVVALTGEGALRRAREDQGILDELEQAAKADRRGLVDEYAKLQEKLKTQERELQALRLKLASGAAGAPTGGDLVEVAGVQLWTPRFEGLDKKAHAAVVDDFRNRHRGRGFVLLSASIEGDGVHVISAVSDSLKDKVKAPEVMQRLGLRGGGRPDFAQGGGVAAGDVEALRQKAGEVMRAMLEDTGAA